MEERSELGGLKAGSVGTGKVILPLFRNALPHFLPLAIFPLMINAAIYGGWWFVGPLIFFVLADYFDTVFGMDERNMDPKATLESQLFWYKLPIWIWATLWPVTFVFVLWQIIVVEQLSTWEIVLLAAVTVGVAQSVFIVGHELVHRRAVWERWIGEFLLASVSYPHYATEHVYLHHPLVGTPRDFGSAPKGRSFWQHLPQDLTGSLIGAWRFEYDRQARHRRPVWHYSNPFWRYFLETSAWYALVYWIGGIWVLLIYVCLCILVVLSMKIINYVQHYGLQRIRLPGGRFERVQPRHSWSAAYKFSKWFHYNMQRHPDHHIASFRRYPLLQHYSDNESPQLPGSYTKLGGLAMFPRQWFQTMDPLVDAWRAHFYPHMNDWRVYDSSAFEARPEAFEEITEIYDASPHLVEWIDRTPQLLDILRDREFTDLNLPDGFGPDSEFEAHARRGLARLYWTHELDVSEMKEQIADFPAQDVPEAVEMARNWSNNKAFQISMHTIRGNLSPTEAGTALSNVTEAAIATVFSAVEEEFIDQSSSLATGGVAMVILGDLASEYAMSGADLEGLFVYQGGPDKYYQDFCHCFLEELRDLTRDNLLFTPILDSQNEWPIRSLANFIDYYSSSPLSEFLDLTCMRCVFATGDSEIEMQFDEARRELLAQNVRRDELITELCKRTSESVEPGLHSIDEMRGGLRDVERAAKYLQLTHACNEPEILAADVVSVFQTASKHELIPASIAERLAEAANMWRNLRGILRLVADNEFAIETASPKVKSIIARSCEMNEVDTLTDVIREMSSRVAADIDALDGLTSNSKEIEDKFGLSR